MALDQVAQQAGVPAPAIRLIAEFEGCLRKVGPDQYAAYLCPARVATIGYGTTVYNATGQPVRIGDPVISRARAKELLAYDLGKVYAPAVRRAAKFRTQGQFGSCVSFTYNCGTAGFKRSTLCWLINQGQYAKAADEFRKWTRGGGRVLPGLVRRREAERRMFLSDSPPFDASPVKTTVPAAAPPVRGPGAFRRFFTWMFRR